MPSAVPCSLGAGFVHGTVFCPLHGMLLPQIVLIPALRQRCVRQGVRGFDGAEDGVHQLHPVGFRARRGVGVPRRIDLCQADGANADGAKSCSSRGRPNEGAMFRPTPITTQRIVLRLSGCCSWLLGLACTKNTCELAFVAGGFR